MSNKQSTPSGGTNADSRRHATSGDRPSDSTTHEAATAAARSNGFTVNIFVERGKFTLNANFAVQAGQPLAIMGPNGAGKSTLLNAIAGIGPVPRGLIQHAGTTFSQHQVGSGAATLLPTAQRGVGILAQKPLLFPHLSVLDNVAFGPRSAGVPKAVARAAARDWLERVELAELAKLKPRSLSGGQAQRAALARTLAANPKVLLLDEPFAALDVDQVTRMRTLLAAHLQERPSLVTLLVTHNAVEALLLAPRLAIFEEGKRTALGDTAQLLAAPETTFALAISGLAVATIQQKQYRYAPSAVSISVESHASHASHEPHEPDARPGRRTAQRPTSVEPARFNAGRLEVTGRLSSPEPSPGGVRVSLQHEPTLVAELPIAHAAALGLASGMLARFTAPETAFSVIPAGRP